MSTEAAAQATVAAPAAPAPSTPAPATGTTAETQNATETVEVDGLGGLPMDAGAIDAFFRGEKPLTVTKENAEAPVIEEKPATATTTTVTTTEGAKPPVETKPPVEPVDDGEGRILPRKIPTQGFDDEGQRAMALQYTLNGNGAKKPGDPGFVTLRAAMTQLETHDTAASKIETKPPEPSRVEVVKTTVTSLSEKLASLRSERAAMSKDERFHDEELNGKTEEIEDTIRELTKQENLLERETEAAAGRKAATEAAANATEKTAREKALEAASAEFPGLRDPKTPIGAAADRIYKEMADPKHPDHAALHAVNAAGIIAERAAREVAKKLASEGKMTYAEAYESITKAPEKAAATTTIPENPLAPKVLPVSGGSTTVQEGGQQPQLTEEKILEMAMDPKQLGKLDDLLYPRKSGWVIGA